MSEPTTLLHNLLKAPNYVVAVFVAACMMAVVAYYVRAPGFALLDSAFVGSLTFCALLGAFVLVGKPIASRLNMKRVKRPFRKLTDEQQQFLLSTRATGKSWFKGYAEGLPWFEELRELGYIELSHPIIFVPGETTTFHFTGDGWKVLMKAAAARDPKGAPQG
jgi:hypothetical protein